MKSSKLVTVRDVGVEDKVRDGPPALGPLHKHTVKVVSTIKE